MTIYNFIEKYKIPEKICDDFIEYHKTNKEYKNKGIVGDGYIDTSIKNSTDVTFYNNSNNQNIKIFFEHLIKTCFDDCWEIQNHLSCVPAIICELNFEEIL